MRLHKEEMKNIDTSKSNLKKLLKEKSTLETECECIRECVHANNRSFPQAVRSHLINSNKCKYLTMYGDNVVPLTKVINLDLTILQKFYESRVPPNLDEESQLFESIISAHTSKFKSSNTSINAKIIDNVRKIDSQVQPDELNRTPSTHRPTCTPSFNTCTTLNHTFVCTVPSMQFGSPTISPFASTLPPPLPSTTFIELRALENVDHLSYKINQLTSPTCKKGKFSEQMSSPHTLLSNAHPRFTTSVTCSEGTVPNQPSLHTLSSSASATDVSYTWYASPVVSSTYPNMRQSSGYSKNQIPIWEILKMVEVTNTSSCTSEQPTIKFEQPKANVDNKSSMEQETATKCDYAHLYDQFNVKLKIMMYRYTSTLSKGNVETLLQCPDLD